jgi:hypothetical protein
MQFQKARRVVAAVALVAVSAASANGQVTSVYLPDANAGSGVVGNMIPFSSVFGAPVGAWSHLTIVPAAMLSARGVQPGHKLVDIQFAACGSGTVQIPNLQIEVGHLQSPLPTFSLADGFVDSTLVYDSAASGPLAYPCVANAWCSMGVGGGNLAWNGVSDVGIYTTHAGLTISSTTGWQGSFWRASALMRHYVNAYQAQTALTSALNALKIGLIFADPATLPASLAEYGQGAPGSLGVPAFGAPQAPAFGNSAFAIGLTQALPGSLAVLMISALQADAQIGVGADARLLVDLSPEGAWFLFPLDVGVAGTALFSAPLPNYAQGLAGLTLFCQWAVLGDPNGQPTVFGLPIALTHGLAVTLGI